MGSVLSISILPHYDLPNQVGNSLNSFDTRNLREQPAPVGQRSWEELVQPWKVLPYARYVLKYYYGAGRLSAAEMMVAMAMRQAAFIPSGAVGGCSTRKIHLTSVGRWAGMSKARVLAVLKKHSPGLLRFVKQMQKHGADNELLTFAVRNRIPLAPQHIQALKAWVAEHAAVWQQGRAKRPLASMIEQLQKDIPNAETLDQAWAALATRLDELPAEDSLLDILGAHFGPLSPEIEALASAYETAIIQPGYNTAFTHYFADYWMKDFSSQESASILMLRAAARGSGDASVKIAVFHSLTELADYLQMDRRTAKKMLDDIAASRGALSSFISLAEPLIPGGSILLAVAMHDPLHPQHCQTGEPTRLQNVNAFDAKGIHSEACQLNSAQQIANAHRAKQIYPKRKSYSKPAQTVSTLIKESYESRPVQSQTENPQQLLARELQNADVVVSADQWKIERIFALQNITPTLSTPLLARTQTDPALTLQAIGWLIYAYEHHAEDGRGIAAPLIFAAKRFKDPIHADYLELAGLGPQSLHKAARSNYSEFWRQVGLRRGNILQKALDRGLRDLLNELLSTELECTDTLDACPLEESNACADESSVMSEGLDIADERAEEAVLIRQPAPLPVTCPQAAESAGQPADPFALGAALLAAPPAQEEPNPFDELLACFSFGDGLEIAEEELRGCVNALLSLKREQPHVFFPIFSQSTLTRIIRTACAYEIGVRLDPRRKVVFATSLVFPMAKAAAEYVFAQMLASPVVLICE